MTIATVLALMADKSESAFALKTAVVFGQEPNAYEEVQHVRAVPENIAPVVVDGMSAQLVHVLLEGARSSAAECNRRAYRLSQDVDLRQAREKEARGSICLTFAEVTSTA